MTPSRPHTPQRQRAVPSPHRLTTLPRALPSALPGTVRRSRGDGIPQAASSVPVTQTPTTRTPRPPPPGSLPSRSARLTAPPRCARKHRPSGQSSPMAPPPRCVPRPSPPGGRRVSPPLPSPRARRARRCRSGAKMASIMEGPLSKWTNVMKGWQYRWFVLDYNAGLLSYYTVRGGGRAGRARRRRGPAEAQGGGGEGTRGVRAPGRPMGTEEAAEAANGEGGGGGGSQWGGAAGRSSGGGEGRCCCWRRARQRNPPGVSRQLRGRAPSAGRPRTPLPRSLARCWPGAAGSRCPGAPRPVQRELALAPIWGLSPARGLWAVPPSRGRVRPAAPGASFPRLAVRYRRAWRARCRPAGASQSRIDFPFSVQDFALPSTNFLAAVC